MHLKRKKSCIKNIGLNNKPQNEDSKNTASNSTETVLTTVPNSIRTVVEPNSICNSKINGYTCLLCNKKYKHSQSLTTHKKTKHPKYNEKIKNIKTQNNNEINILTQQLEETKQKLANIEQLINTHKIKKGKTKIINNNNNNGTINNNNNIVINIIPPSNEQSKTLLQHERNQIMIQSHESLNIMISYTNFNDAHP